MQQPSVTTFLFTDIEGSTRLWEQAGKRMVAALAQHDAVLRAAVERNHGEIWKMTGDGIYAAFANPLDAVVATLALQQSLIDPATTNGIPIRVRCGLHLGAAEHRDGEYFGAAVNRTSQIMNAGHGGQIIVSRAVVDAIGERLPKALSLRDFGRVRLKDLATPEHICQVLHPALQQDFPPLRSLAATPNNLPQQITSFVGRERELAEAKELIRNHRLVTLLGMGGLGKTRLSMQLGAEVMNEYPDGVWFIDLAAITDPALVPGTAAQVLGVREEPGRTLIRTLCAYLKSQKLILIVDNCEHVVNACVQLIEQLLKETAEVRIIATTREALHVFGEAIYPIHPLELPARDASVETLARSEAVQLFVERARLQKPAFALTERDAPVVAEICSRLDGIPLAMELAAARIRSLSVQDINSRLKDRFKLLTGGSRVAMERQQTLRALVAWSYDMLHEAEKRLLERLSVFAGGFELAAAKAVCGVEPIAPDAVHDLLSSLVDKSLAMPVQVDTGARYRQLETIREFARDCLVERGERELTAVRHCDHFFVLAKAARKHLQGPEQGEWSRRMEVELDNLRAGISLALQGETDPFIAIKYEVALMGFRLLRGYSTEGRTHIRAALALPAVQASALARGHALYVGGALAIDQSDYAEAQSMLEECLALRRDLGNPADIAATLSTLAQVRLQLGDPESARGYDEEALALFRQLDAKVEEAIGIGHLGDIAMYLARDDDARQHFEQCLANARAISHRELEGECERKLGEIALEQGDLVGARALFVRSHTVCHTAEDKRGEAMAVWYVGKTDAACGDCEAAHAKLSAALRAFKAFEMNAQVLGCLEDHAHLQLALGRADVAARLYATVDNVRQRLALKPPPRALRKSSDGIAAARAALGSAAFDAGWAQGRAWELDQAIRSALSPLQAEAITA